MAGSPIVFRTDQGASGASNTAKTAVDIVALLARGLLLEAIWPSYLNFRLLRTAPAGTLARSHNSLSAVREFHPGQDDVAGPNRTALLRKLARYQD